jgi:squalene-associated FAD-dependent desaturase
MAKELTASPSSKPRTVILGGGLAGMSAACHLLDEGWGVTLVEKRPYLGGRAFSFTDRETGQVVDNGQHVFLGCYTYYMDFLEKIGTLQRAYIQDRTRVDVVSPDGPSSSIAAGRLPKPFHMLPSFLSYKHLGLWDKLTAIYGLLRLNVTDRSKPSLQKETFGRWLRRHRQTKRTIENFWNLIVKPCVNDDVEDVSAAMGIMIFQEGLLKSPQSSRIGYAREGLSSLMGEAAQKYVESRGGRVITGQVASLHLNEDGPAGEYRIAGVQLSGGDVLHADAYVSALPLVNLMPLLPPQLGESALFASLEHLQTAPIVNVYLWYDRPVMEQDFVALVDSPLQWVFNKSSIMNRSEAQGQYVTVSLSAAFDYVNQPKQALQQMCMAAMADAFPKAKSARVTRSLVVKQEKATFRCLPGSERFRPAAQTPVQNLFLAGDWTDTGWPSTMEGAVRSGVTAAQAVLKERRN